MLVIYSWMTKRVTMQLKENLGQIPQIRVLPFYEYSASFNMAADEYFLRHSEDTVLRFYGWNKPTLSFGKSRLNLDELNMPFCQSSGFDFVKRITGGKTVFHHLELTYSLILPSRVLPKNVKESYREISEILRLGILEAGVSPTMSPAVQTDITDNCFQEISSYELAVNNKKLVGSAQHRTRQRLLQHGSILLKIDWNTWKDIWRLPRESLVLEERITSIYDETGQDIRPLDLSQAVTKAFQDSLGVKCEEFPFQSSELEVIQKMEAAYQFTNDSLS